MFSLEQFSCLIFGSAIISLVDGKPHAYVSNGWSTSARILSFGNRTITQRSLPKGTQKVEHNVRPL